MINVFIISEGDDVGGVGIAIQRAFEKYAPDWNVVSMRGKNNYIDYPVHYSWDQTLFKSLWRKADVIHTMEKLHNLTPYYNPPGKPLVLHHHGSIYRDNHAAVDLVANEHNLQQICSTIDLTIYNPNVQWIGNPIDLDLMRAIRHQYKPAPRKEPLFIHSPTQRWAKGSEEFIKATKKLNYKVKLIEGQTWTQALTTKATGDILLDQLTYGYGLSGLEAMAMGIPVVGGLLPQVRGVFLDTLGGVPFFETPAGRVQELLPRLIDPDLRRRVAESGQAYVRMYHDEPVIVNRLKELYTKAIDEYKPEGKWA